MKRAERPCRIKQRGSDEAEDAEQVKRIPNTTGKNYKNAAVGPPLVVRHDDVLPVSRRGWERHNRHNREFHDNDNGKDVPVRNLLHNLIAAASGELAE